jgi:hypothetical protein
MIKSLAIFLLTSCISFAADAKTAPAPKQRKDTPVSVTKKAEWTSLEITDRNFDPFDLSMRLKFAQHLLATVDPVYNSLPNLSPQQEGWLKQEKERIQKLNNEDLQSQSLLKLTERYEYKLQKAKQTLFTMQSALKAIIQYEKDKTKAALPGWLVVSHQLVHPGAFDSIAELDKKGMIKLPKGKQFSAYSSDLLSNDVGSDIMVYILLPHRNRLSQEN